MALSHVHWISTCPFINAVQLCSWAARLYARFLPCARAHPLAKLHQNLSFSPLRTTVQDAQPSLRLVIEHLLEITCWRQPTGLLLLHHPCKVATDGRGRGTHAHLHSLLLGHGQLLHALQLRCAQRCVVRTYKPGLSMVGSV